MNAVLESNHSIRDNYVQKKIFVIIHNNIYKKLDNVSAQAERLYRILREYSNAEYKAVFPKTKTLATRMKVSLDSITRYIKELVREKLIVIKKNKHSNQNIYHFNTENITSSNKIHAALKAGKTQDTTPHDCGNINNINLTKSNITTNKENVVVDKDLLNELTEKYSSITKKMNIKNTQLYDKSFIDKLQNMYNTDFIDMLKTYISFSIDKQNVEIKNPSGFLRHLIKNLSEVDFSQFFKYLENLAKVKSKKLKQKKNENLNDKLKTEYENYRKKALKEIERDNEYQENRKIAFREVLRDRFMLSRYDRDKNSPFVISAVNNYLFSMYEKKTYDEFAKS